MNDDPLRDVEALARPEARAGLPFGRLLRLYLDPGALLKSAAIAPAREALRYNRARRRMLLVYARRWALIALACLLGAAPLCAQARAEPILCLPIVGLELGFSSGLCMAFFSLAMYILLGCDERKP